MLGALDYDLDEIANSIGQITNVPGRMQSVRHAEQPLIVIDYAHTPDALNQALRSLREHISGEVWCVFGCGGDRDMGKREEMGEIASENADHLILTNDNPRFENPNNITNDIIKGIVPGKEYEIELSREVAISRAIRRADVQDAVLIAGKGHEAYQEVQGEKQACSDFKVVEQCLGIAHLT